MGSLSILSPNWWALYQSTGCVPFGTSNGKRQTANGKLFNRCAHSAGPAERYRVSAKSKQTKSTGGRTSESQSAYFEGSFRHLVLLLFVKFFLFWLCFGCPFGADFCYLWCLWAPFFLSWAPFLGLGGALGPLGLQGLILGPKKVDFSSVPRRKTHQIWTLSCSFSGPFRRAVFGVVLRWALDTLFGPKGCPSGAKGSFQRPKRVPLGAFWYHVGAIF